MESGPKMLNGGLCNVICQYAGVMRLMRTCSCVVCGVLECEALDSTLSFMVPPRKCVAWAALRIGKSTRFCWSRAWGSICRVEESVVHSGQGMKCTGVA